MTRVRLIAPGLTTTTTDTLGTITGPGRFGFDLAVTWDGDERGPMLMRAGEVEEA